MSTSRSTILSRPSTDDRETDEMSASKRRKVRKGTRSCWECRQRKMKCIFEQPTDSICVRCHRRGIKCVSQEYPEEITSSLDRSLQMSDRMIRLENLVEKLLNRGPIEESDTVVEEDKRGSPAPLLPSAGHSRTLTAAEPLEKPQDNGFDILNEDTGSSSPKVIQISSIGRGKHEKLSQTLHASLPSSNEIRTIVNACGNTSSLFYQMQIVPYKNLDKTISLESMFATPSLNAHPVLIARHMLHVATALQHLHPNFTKDADRLSEPPREMMRRLSAIAINIVTTNDDLIYCIEGLECMMIESWFHTNGGNLRKGLVTIRRAMTIAELMGFHRQGKAQCKVVDRGTKAYPEFIWHRITALERYLCLMLGIPQATNDHNMISETALLNDTPIGRLDRIHSVVTSRILQRNQSRPGFYDPALARDLDEQLRSASKGLPDKWWLIPNLATVANQPEALFWDMRRLFHHLFHYNLLIQLHLPYMLSSAAAGHRYGHSQIVCVNSARDVLCRFVMFHSFNRIAFSCRTVDFFALMAAMTLLLVHIDGHRQENPPPSDLPWPQGLSMTRDNPFIHQRPSDRALIESIIDIVDQVSRIETETTSTQISSILVRLMKIEAEAAEQSTRTPAPDKAPSLSGSSDVVRMSIPHFGIIDVTSQGIDFKDCIRIQQGKTNDTESRFQAPEDFITGGTQAGYGDRSSFFNRQSMYHEGGAGTSPHQTNDSLVEATMAPVFNSPSRTRRPVSDDDPKFHITQTSHSNSDYIPRQNQEPSSNAEQDIGIGQDVDLAFFDTLMRGIGVDENESIDWLAWLNVP